MNNALINTLIQAFNELDIECFDDNEVRKNHGQDQSPYVHISLPDLVVFPVDSKQVSDIVRIANRFELPVIPFGEGTSVEGHVLAIKGGITINMSKMNQIIEVCPSSFTATVQPGVTRNQLDKALEELGVSFPIGPGVNASIGGMCATGASGTNAVKYGTMKENVLALEVVTSEGLIAKTGSKAKKTSAGYDLTHLIVGSEGTLGIITEITIKLYPIPEIISAAICSFQNIQAAILSVIKIIQESVPIAKVELIDGHTMSLVNKYSNLSLSECPKLLMEFHGSQSYIEEQVDKVSAIVSEYGGSEFTWATDANERNKLWQARHNAYYAAIASKKNARSVSTDTCVPIDRLAECLLASIEEVNSSGIPYFLVGHVGDGNFHFGYLIDPENEEEKLIAEELNNNLAMRAIDFEGTCTGEHGVGMHKINFLNKELGDVSVDLMKKIKLALDPKNILNPGKVIHV